MRSIARVHADWLRLLEAAGFTSLPVLKRAFPQGLATHDPEHFALMREAYEECRTSCADTRRRVWTRLS